ncbi:MAG: Minf_1886 family protein, partial [Planctomycetota bacterium]
QLALEQFGLMARVVLNSWGIRSTGDVGEIVYNLIGIGMMKKSPSDRREDFEDVFDFEEAFEREFKITPPRKAS